MSKFILSAITAPPLTGSGAELMPAHTTSFGEGLLELLRKAFYTLRPDLAEATRICFGILAVVLLISIVKLLPGAKENTADFVGAVGISTLLLGSSNALVKLSVDTVQNMSHYGKLLLPVMTSALAAQGGVTASAALYAGTALFDTILCSLLTQLLIPAVYIYLTLSVACAATGEALLKKLSGFVKWLSVWILKTVLYVFTGYMGITGVVSGTTDAATLKAAKITISGVVPVVGGILSDASEAVLVSAGIMKNAAGIYGILAILAGFAGPFLRVGCHYLLVKFTAAVCSVFGAKRTTELVSDFSAAMGLLLAMLGSVCLLQLISTVCFLRGVG